MSEIEQLVEEVGAVPFRPLSTERRESIKNSSWRDYDPDADTTMTLDQAKRFADAAEGQVSSTEFSDDDAFFEVLDKITHDWPDVELRFAGCIGEYGYLDAVYVCYEDIIADWEDDDSYFREYMTLHFKYWMDWEPEDNEGICPCCDDRIEFANEMFRDDDNLWASPDEFDFREYPHFGKCVRMWWDD